MFKGFIGTAVEFGPDPKLRRSCDDELQEIAKINGMKETESDEGLDVWNSHSNHGEEKNRYSKDDAPKESGSPFKDFFCTGKRLNLSCVIVVRQDGVKAHVLDAFDHLPGTDETSVKMDGASSGGEGHCNRGNSENTGEARLDSRGAGGAGHAIDAKIDGVGANEGDQGGFEANIGNFLGWGDFSGGWWGERKEGEIR